MSKVFFKMFPYWYKNMDKITSGELKFLLILSYLMSFSSNCVVFDSEARKLVLSKMKISSHSLTNIINSLKKKKLIAQNGAYLIVNKEFSAKGLQADDSSIDGLDRFSSDFAF